MAKINIESSWRGGFVRLLGLSLVLGLGFWGCTPARKPAAQTQTSAGDRTFTILQINDVYRIEGVENGSKGSMARIRTIREQLEAQDEVLLLHAGDLLFPSVMSKYFKAKPMVDTLNRLDGDAAAFDPHLIATFGNHEFDEKRDIFEARLRQSDFQWISSNVFYVPPGKTEGKAFHDYFNQVAPYQVVDIAGLKVGIFGVTLDDYKAEYIRFDYDPNANQSQVPAIKNAVAQLKAQNVDLIIALTHQTATMDQKLACDVPDIDLIIGGHEHLAMSTDGCDTQITKADADAVTAWIIQVDASKPGKPVLKKTLRKLDDTVAKDPDVQAFVDKQVIALSEEVPDYFKPYGSTVHMLEGVEPAIRGRETAMGNWLTDVARQRMGTEIAFLNGGGIRINDNIPAGSDIRGEHLAGIFYYSTNLVSFNLTGAELKEILNNSISLVDLGAGRFLQVSGIRFKYRKANEAKEGARFLVMEDSIRVRDAGEIWRPLDLSRTYSVTTSEYLWKKGSGDGYQIFSLGDGGTSPPLTSDPNLKVDLRKTVENFLKRDPVVRQDVEGRIGRVSPPKL